MSRGFYSLTFSILALFVLACCTGCPEPTPPVAKPQGNGTGTTENVEPPKENSPADDAELVKSLQDAGHKLKLDDEGHVVEATLVPLGNVEKTIALLENVAKLPHLVRLKAGGPDVTNAGLEKIQGLKKLRVLDLDQAGVDDAGMKYLVDLPLVDINLKLTNIQDEGLKDLAKIKTLKQLKLIKTKVTNAGIAHVKGMENLEGIDLQDVNTVDSACLNDIKGLKKLRFLRIYGPTFDGDGIAPIGEMTTLRTLSMQQTGVSDDNVKHLKDLVNLEKLYLYGTHVTDTGMAQLAGLTKLKELELRATACGGDGMEYLKQMLDLQMLDLSECNAPTLDKALETIGTLKHLEDLNLWNTYLTDNGVASLSGLTTLKALNLDNIKGVTDASMDTIAKLTSLEYLHLGGTGITDAGLAKLHTLKNLKKSGDRPGLVLTFTNTSDAAVEALMEAIPALKEDGAIRR